MDLVVSVQQNRHEEADYNEEKETKRDHLFILVVVFIEFSLTEVIWVVLMIFAKASSFSFDSIITDSTCSTHKIVHWMLWTRVSVRTEVPLRTFLTCSTNEVVRTCSQIFLVVLIRRIMTK